MATNTARDIDEQATRLHPGSVRRLRRARHAGDGLGVAAAVSYYSEWCDRQQVSHGHCPRECEHPQPFYHPEFGMLCGKCWFDLGEISVIVACDCD